MRAVLITGAGSGIGEATAKYFSEKNWNVVLCGRHKEKLERVAASLKSESLVLSVDVRKAPEVEFMVHESLKKFPSLDTVINNAAVFDTGSFVNSTSDLWSKTLETNLMGPVCIMKGFLPSFLKNKQGMFVNVASTAGLRPVPGVSVYGTSKAALIHLTQSLALEYASQGVRFHAVCPGVVDTPIHKTSPKAMASQHPMGRIGTPQEVAKAIYYLAAESEWMTGVVLPVDGGISLK